MRVSIVRMPAESAVARGVGDDMIRALCDRRSTADLACALGYWLEQPGRFDSVPAQGVARGIAEIPPDAPGNSYQIRLVGPVWLRWCNSWFEPATQCAYGRAERR